MLESAEKYLLKPIHFYFSSMRNIFPDEMSNYESLYDHISKPNFVLGGGGVRRIELHDRIAHFGSEWSIVMLSLV